MTPSKLFRLMSIRVLITLTSPVAAAECDCLPGQAPPGELHATPPAAQAPPAPMSAVDSRRRPAIRAVAPPPGTLGRTYKRRSSLLPEGKHPRFAMIKVYNVPEHAEISSRGLKANWFGDHWRLETASPLMPGQPHVFAITVTDRQAGPPVTDTRWVRLIMGRIVELNFQEPHARPHREHDH